ncbi:heavy-metal-associated domain-containing protein [Symbiobacterium terraclitae]|uniref:heavy-metal-associated domain-containing protein n=1 Tax=Symbiobacterium terraclitae TaxID=557451 RepID=UPI0035B5522D
MGCRASVEAELQDVPGTRYIEVNLQNQTATIVFDPSKADLDALRAAMGRAGYTPKTETVVDG